jgi:hypothetical protein
MPLFHRVTRRKRSYTKGREGCLDYDIESVGVLYFDDSHFLSESPHNIDFVALCASL